MKKLPSLYTQKHTKTEVLKFISEFKQELLRDIQNYFNLIEVDAPLIINQNLLFFKERNINFDTLNETNIYQIAEYCDMHLIKLIHEQKEELGFFTYYLSIQRDAKKTYSQSLGEYKILMTKNILLADANNDILIKYIHELITIINERIKDKLKNTNLIPKNFKVINYNQVKKMYPTINIDDAIYQILLSKKSVLFIDVNKSGNLLLNRKETLNFFKNAAYCVYYETNNEPLELFNLYIVPTIQQINNQFKYTRGIEINQSLINEVFSSYNDTIIIEINFSKLLMYILNKIHIVEVAPLPADEQTLKDFIKNKLFTI